MGKFASSIKWRFIVIYVVLVLIVMGIIGTFIIGRLETVQLQKVEDDTEANVSSLMNSSSYLMDSPWEEISPRIQNTLDEWRIGNTDAVYMISYGKTPKIVASTVNTSEIIAGSNAYAYKELSSYMVIEGLNGEGGRAIREDPNTHVRSLHYVQPVLDQDGSLQGLIYSISDLSVVYSTINDAKRILTYATMIALISTSLLAYILAESITGPIRDLIDKAQEMAEGDFNQRVEVKSKDEIGQLGIMFNYLTMELSDTIAEMDTEKSKLDTIFNYMREGVIAVDSMGGLILANPIARNILNINQDDLDEEIYWDVSNLNIKEVNYNQPDTLVGVEQLEINGGFYNVRYAPYKNDLGQDIGMIVVLQDVTKEHNLDSMRKEFVANVSHELKTPITTIKSYTETLLMGGVNGETSDRFLNIINRETDRMNYLVRDLLQLSNMDADRKTWDITVIEPTEWIRNILESMQPLAAEKNQVLDGEVSEHISSFYADDHGSSQVLVNILSNAIKYTPEGGHITVRAKNYGTRVHIEVVDNGVGIPPEDLDRIFERFYRVEKGRSRREGGTGLGLAIAKEVIESMEGRIHIRSEVGKGTTVVLSFPREEEHDERTS